MAISERSVEMVNILLAESPGLWVAVITGVAGYSPFNPVANHIDHAEVEGVGVQFSPRGPR